MTFHICNFSGPVSELSPKQKKNHMAVLEAIAENGMISTWDMGEHGLWKTVFALLRMGYLLELKRDYPWHQYILTQLGQDWGKTN